MNKLLIFTNIPSPYKVELFNEISKKIDLVVVFERQFSLERQKEWHFYTFNNFKAIFLKGINYKFDQKISLGFIRHLIKFKDYPVLVSNPFTLTGILAQLFLKIINRNYYVFTDGAFVKKESYLKYNFKKFLLKGNKGYFYSNLPNKIYFLHYKVKIDKLIHYHFTSIRQNEILKPNQKVNDKSNLKSKMNIVEKKILLFVGQFIYRKGIDYFFNLIKCFDDSVVFILIGGELMKFKENKNVLTFKHLNKEDLLEFYRIADLFIFPTREDIWGLVINEALSQGLPVLTTINCGAAHELVINKNTGLIIDFNNLNESVSKINSLLKDQNRLSEFKINALNISENYTIEVLAKDIIDNVK